MALCYLYGPGVCGDIKEDDKGVAEEQEDCKEENGGFGIDDGEGEEESCSEYSSKDDEKFSSVFDEVIGECSQDEFKHPWEVADADDDGGSGYRDIFFGEVDNNKDGGERKVYTFGKIQTSKEEVFERGYFGDIKHIRNLILVI